MTPPNRPAFLQTIGSLFALPAISQGAQTPKRTHGYDFLAPEMPDAGTDRIFHGYPDECYAFTAFADSLAALTAHQPWSAMPAITDTRAAIVVDFASTQEAEAEASIARGWYGPWEYPMGAAFTEASRTAVNAQNDCITRHLALIGTATQQREFHNTIVESLLDSRTCKDAGCTVCPLRGDCDLARIFNLLAHLAGPGEVHLFSRWEPSKDLREALALGIDIVWHPLDKIPAADLEANRRYHIWDGTPKQGEVFRDVVWAPRWKRGARS
jgi:hypothetical protein